MARSRLRPLCSFGRDDRAVVLVEFALVVPLLITIGLAGTELSNYTITKMRVSQLALQIADNGSRMGDVDGSGVKTVTENNVNEIFAGGELQSGGLDVQNHGRVILTDLEPVATPNTTSKFKIQWQRCYGTQTSYKSNYGKQGDTGLSGIGPTGRQVTAMDGSATMFVEVFYTYTPLFTARFLPSTTFDEIASMAVRDQRTTGVAPTAVAGVTASTC